VSEKRDKPLLPAWVSVVNIVEEEWEARVG
jgi:hypothetical protein